jgi:hypothetical protein
MSYIRKSLISLSKGDVILFLGKPPLTTIWLPCSRLCDHSPHLLILNSEAIYASLNFRACVQAFGYIPSRLSLADEQKSKDRVESEAKRMAVSDAWSVRMCVPCLW